MAYETILYALEDGVAKLTLNRPEKLNALNSHMHGEIAAALDQCRKSGCAGAAPHRGGRGFCTGQDLSAFRTLKSGIRVIRWSITIIP